MSSQVTCVSCLIRSISQGIRSGVYSWEKIKPRVRALVTVHGYNPAADIAEAQKRKLHEAKKLGIVKGEEDKTD